MSLQAVQTGRFRPPVYDSAAVPRPFVEEWLELYLYRDLVWQWTRRNIKLRYKRSVLGVLWTLIEPLMLTAIIGVVFSNVFRVDLPSFPVYLLSGLLMFDFFSRSTLQITEEIIVSEGLADRIYLPRSAFAVAAVLTYSVNWLIALIPLLIMMSYFGITFSWALLTVPVAMVLIACFALGVGLIVATLGASFHDVKLTYQVLLTAWFYGTPIMYPLEIVPDSFQPFVQLNPLYHMSRLVRGPVYESRLPSLTEWGIGLALGLGGLLLGWWVFTRRRGSLAGRS